MWGTGPIYPREKTIDVQGGAKLSAVVRKLASEGFALEHPPSFLEMSVAGAISTASHGSFPSGQSLAASVVSLDIIDLQKKRLEVSPTKQKHIFDAVIGGVGSVAFIDSVQLRIVPQRRLTRFDYALPFSDVFGSSIMMSAILQAHSHWLTIQFSPLCDSAIIRTASPAIEGREESAAEKYFNYPFYKHSMRLVQPFLKLAAYVGESANATFMASLASSTSSKEGSSASTSEAPMTQPFLATNNIMNFICSAMELPTSFTTDATTAVSIPRPGNMGTWVEYYIDRSHTSQAASAVKDALRSAHDAGKINFNGLVTVTFVAQESTVLAPNANYDAAAIEVTTFFQGFQVNVVKIVEEALKPFNPIPHLGSFHTLPGTEIKARHGTDAIKTFSETLSRVTKQTNPFQNSWKRQNFIDAPNAFSKVKL